MITYAPYFISTVVLVGMLIRLTNARYGLISKIIQAFGGPPTDLMASADNFRPLYVFSGVWQGMGYSAVIYIAALSNADPSLYEAALIDGANRWQQMLYITLPSLAFIIAVQLVMQTGKMLQSNRDLILLLYRSN